MTHSYSGSSPVATSSDPGSGLHYSPNSSDFTSTKAVIASIERVDEEIHYHETARRTRVSRLLGIVASLVGGNLGRRLVWIEQIRHHQRELERLKKLRLAYETFLSPIQRIPIEVLEYILDYAVEKNCFGWQKSQCKSDAYNLGWVCSRWRRIIQSMPHLWAYISMKIHRAEFYPPMAIRQLEDHLLRSAGSPLFVEMELLVENDNGVNRSRSHPNSETFYNLVLEQSERWMSFKYIHSSMGFYRHAIFLKFLAQKMPALRSLEIDLNRIYDQYLPSELANHLLSSPFNTVVRQLTRLRIEVSTSDAVGVLLSCPNLATAHFILPTTLIIPISPAVHKRLRALTLESPYLHQMIYFLSSLTCPSLFYLSLSVKNSEFQRNPRITPSNFTQDFVRFLHRSESLRTLQLANTSLGPSQFISILRRVPLLQSLEIADSSVQNTDNLFHALHSSSNEMERSTTCSPKTLPLVPMLREVNFTFDNDWRSNAFESMLQSRVDGKLESVFLRIRGERKYLDVDYLRRINLKANLAVRVVEGDDKREVVGYCEPHPEVMMPRNGKTWLQQIVSSLSYTGNMQAIDSINSSVQSIDGEIEMANTEAEIGCLKQLRRELQMLLSPFHRLPIGVLTYIFEYAVEQNTFGWKQCHFRSDGFTLAHVCHRWRKLTESQLMSHLWASISLKINPNAHYPPITLQKLKDHLRRSSHSPLSLEVEVFAASTMGNNDSFAQFLDEVLQLAHLWKSFKYTQHHSGDQGDTYPLLDLVLNRKLPSLQRLEVELDRSYDHELVPPQIERVLETSPLQAVCISFGANRTASVIQHLWSINLLTHLCVEAYPTDALCLVSSCRNLVTAHFKLADGEKITLTSISFEKRPHKNLRELTLESPTSETPLRLITFFLSFLTCPSLISMSVSASLPLKPEGIQLLKNDRDGGVRSASFFIQLIGFFRRSNSRKVLKSFRFVENFLAASEMADVLCELPSLHTLEMDMPNIHLACLFDILAPWSYSAELDLTKYYGRPISFPMLREVKFTVESVLGSDKSQIPPRLPLPWHAKELRSVFLRVADDAKESLDVRWLEWLNANSNLAVRVVKGDDGREIVGY